MIINQLELGGTPPITTIPNITDLKLSRLKFVYKNYNTIILQCQQKCFKWHLILRRDKRTTIITEQEELISAILRQYLLEFLSNINKRVRALRFTTIKECSSHNIISKKKNHLKTVNKSETIYLVKGI